jgi:hypothetical protein
MTWLMEAFAPTHLYQSYMHLTITRGYKERTKSLMRKSHVVLASS